MSYFILVTGSRHWDHNETIVHWLDGIEAEIGAESMVVITGGARGADAIAAEWASGLVSRGGKHFEIPANWKEHGKKAGVLRNQEMLDLARKMDADELNEWTNVRCLAFPLPGSIGTWDMVRRCERAYVPVYVEGHER